MQTLSAPATNLNRLIGLSCSSRCQRILLCSPYGSLLHAEVHAPRARQPRHYSSQAETLINRAQTWQLTVVECYWEAAPSPRLEREKLIMEPH